MGILSHRAATPGARLLPSTDSKPDGEPKANRPVAPRVRQLATKPDRSRIGLLRWEGGIFEHYCCVCGRWGAFGYDVDLLKGQLGRWYCGEHRPSEKQRGASSG